ncbi:PA4780 family RIO1-like protein kinase [Marinomonas communis]|uniref:non-specific serine/threonine protein kinase n=1 Tax=Marinomonas communis TaxID=28254 RepID=A0A4R6XEF2_9GAMM|nr:PA4780 family RIO1-like protein kinase [Marinomonas communis]TDR15627.1 RIO kinase 1 [Marinomonas communis]
MKTPKRLQPLIEDGLIDEVISQLMSGKEATVFMVRCGSEIRCAKVYKDAGKHSFKQAVQYREGRKVRNSRQARAMAKGSKYGREEQESLWHNAEVDALYKLAQANVRVPKPYGCIDGVLLMELITDADGDVAPRLNDVKLTQEEALAHHSQVIRDVVRMLCAGLVHGDLSEFNVLVDQDGPVIIDLPQAVDAVANNHAEWMLERDINNMRDYYGQFAPELLTTQYAKEIWEIYESGKLTPETELTGHFDEPTESADVDAVMSEIQEAFKEEQERLARMQSADED